MVGSADRVFPRRLAAFTRGRSERLALLPGTPLRVVTYKRA